jgi:hypothetical protein
MILKAGKFNLKITHRELNRVVQDEDITIALSEYSDKAMKLNINIIDNLADEDDRFASEEATAYLPKSQIEVLADGVEMPQWLFDSIEVNASMLAGWQTVSGLSPEHEIYNTEYERI